METNFRDSLAEVFKKLRERQRGSRSGRIFRRETQGAVAKAEYALYPVQAGTIPACSQENAVRKRPEREIGFAARGSSQISCLSTEVSHCWSTVVGGWLEIEFRVWALKRRAQAAAIRLCRIETLTKKLRGRR